MEPVWFLRDTNKQSGAPERGGGGGTGGGGMIKMPIKIKII